MIFAVAATRDLIFSTKITSTAQALGINARAVGGPEALAALLDAGGVRLVMVDMALAEDVAVRAVECAVGHASRPTVLAFFSHVHGALGEAARRAGASLVMPRSKFSEELPDLLRTYCDAHGSESTPIIGTAGINPDHIGTFSPAARRMGNDANGEV